MSLLDLRMPPPATPADHYDAVAEESAALVIRRYSTSFGVASRLLGPAVRPHVRNVYALVRVADEIVQLGRAPEAQKAGVEHAVALCLEVRIDDADALVVAEIVERLPL